MVLTKNRRPKFPSQKENLINSEHKILVNTSINHHSKNNKSNATDPASADPSAGYIS